MERIVIGLTGSLCSGKGNIATHLEEKGFQHLILSDRLREEILSRGQTITRSLLQDVGNELREKYGGAVLAERTAKLIDGISGNVVIDGVRNPDEVTYLRNVLGAVIIGVDAPPELRQKWYLARAKERKEDSVTEEDFKKVNDRDFGVGELGTGQQVGKCLEMADITFKNTGTKDSLYRICDLYLKIVLDFDPEIHSPHIEKK
jgi:dephospho-CoA kinase